MTLTVANTETVPSLEIHAPAADVHDLLGGPLEMDWTQSETVVYEHHVKSFGQVMGFALLLSAGLWAVIFGLLQII